MTSLYTLVYFTAILVISQYIYAKWKSFVAFRSAVRQHGCQRPPRYPHRDLLGLGRDLHRERMKAFQDGRGQTLWAQNFAECGKTFEENSYWQKTITTMEPANIQYVGALAFKDFVRGDQFRQGAGSRFLGRGILSENGVEWKQSRDLIKPIFFRGELADVSIIGKHVNRFLDLVPRDNSTFDAQPLIQKLFLDTSSEFFLGESLHALGPDTPDETKIFLDTFNDAVRGHAYWRSAPWPYYHMYRYDKSFARTCNTLHALFDRHVQRALDETAPSVQRKQDQNKESGEERADPTRRYILLNEMAKEIRDPIALRSQTMNVFLVARDNVAMVTANALFHLARNPNVWTDLRREAAERIGSQPLTFELLKSLTLFKFVYQETLRLQGPAIFSIRTAIRNTILPTGGGPNGTAPVFVEKGTIVHMNNWSLHHDLDIWGKDAYVFKPERWASTEDRLIWKFVPFFGGPRICPALQQVYTQFMYILVRLVQNFEGVSNRDPVVEYVTSVKLTFESKNGVKIALSPARTC